MKNKRRKVAVVTGARAEYGLLKPVMKKIDRSKRLELCLIVTGAHLSKKFGYTITDIINDGFKISAKVPMYNEYESTNISDSQIPKCLSRGLAGLAGVFERLKPDILVLLGDRGEPLMAAIAAGYLNIPIAHIHGGDQAMGADIDDNIRHAITKLAHIHFPATEKSARRIRCLGEEDWRTHVVGAPGLDSILNRKMRFPKQFIRALGFSDNKPIVLLLQHAVSSETDKAEYQMLQTMSAITELGCQTVVLYPNTDPGNLSIVKVIEKYRGYPFIKILKSLPHESFLALMNAAAVMVGNSSSAIIEAPSFKLPVIDIGIRQAARERSTNVIEVGHSKRMIKHAIIKAIYDKKFRALVLQCRNPYGDGKASSRIVKILSNESLDNRLKRKEFNIDLYD